MRLEARKNKNKCTEATRWRQGWRVRSSRGSRDARGSEDFQEESHIRFFSALRDVIPLRLLPVSVALRHALSHLSPRTHPCHYRAFRLSLPLAILTTGSIIKFSLPVAVLTTRFFYFAPFLTGVNPWLSSMSVFMSLPERPAFFSRFSPSEQ